MLYFKYNDSFKKVSSLVSLLKKQHIEEIYCEEEFNKHFAKNENIYSFIDSNVLNWALTEGDAWDMFFDK